MHLTINDRYPPPLGTVKMSCLLLTAVRRHVLDNVCDWAMAESKDPSQIVELPGNVIGKYVEGLTLVKRTAFPPQDSDGDHKLVFYDNMNSSSSENVETRICRYWFTNKRLLE